MDLTLKRGKSTLTIVKARGRKPRELNKPVLFWSDDDTFRFENDQQALGKLNLSARLKSLRQGKGMLIVLEADRIVVAPEEHRLV